MGRPYGLLRAGFPFHKTLGMRRLTNFPIDLAIGQEDRLYILCRSEGTALIRRYSTEDKDLGNFGSYGSDPGQMTWPVTILADGDENLYLTDESLHRVTILDKEGELLDSWGEEGSGAGQLNGPTGMDFDAEGNLYVVDTPQPPRPEVHPRGRLPGPVGQLRLRRGRVQHAVGHRRR